MSSNHYLFIFLTSVGRGVTHGKKMVSLAQLAEERKRKVEEPTDATREWGEKEEKHLQP